MSLLTDLISFWRLDEASGTRYDSHGSNDLADNNTVGSATGVVGNAADFESGNSEYLSIADNAGLSAGDIDFAVLAWIKLESDTEGVILGKWAVGSLEYSLQYLKGSYGGGSVANRLHFGVSNNGSGFTFLPASTLGAPSTATWYLIHGWHDAANDIIGISVNAGPEDTTAYSTGVHNGTARFIIGAQDDSGSPAPFDGLIDEVYYRKGSLPTADERIWLYARTPYDLFGDSSAELTVASGADEAAISSSPSFTTSPSGINIGAGIYDYTGLWRFTGLSAAKGGTITKAFLLFVADGSYDSTGYSMSIDAVDADNPSMPSDYSDYSGRTFTTAVDTGDFGNLVDGQKVISLDCTSVIQELADRSGWSGVALLRGQSTSSTVTVKGDAGGYPARLFVRWQAGGGPTPITADVPVGSIDFTAIAPTTRHAAAVPAGLIDFTAVSPATTKSASLSPAVVEFVSLAPATAKQASVAAVSVEFAALAPDTLHVASLSPAIVAFAGIAPDTAKTAAVDAARVAIIGLSAESNQAADVPTAAIAITGIEPDTAKAAAVESARVEFLAIAPDTSKVAAVPLGVVAFTSLTPAISKSAAVAVGLIEFVGIAPETAKLAALDPVVIAFVGVAMIEVGEAAGELVFTVYLSPSVGGRASLATIVDASVSSRPTIRAKANP